MFHATMRGVTYAREIPLVTRALHDFLHQNYDSRSKKGSGGERNGEVWHIDDHYAGASVEFRIVSSCVI